MAVGGSMKIRMTLAVGAFVVLFFTLMAIATLAYFQGQFKDHLERDQDQFLAVVADDLDAHLVKARAAIVAVAEHLPPGILERPEQAQAFLDARRGTATLFDNGLFLFSPRGRLVAESPFIDPARRGRDISFRDYFQATVRERTPHISSPYLSTHNPGQPAVIITAPVFDRELRLVAICAGSLNLLSQNFLGDLARARIGDSGYLTLLDRDRTIISHPDREKLMSRAPSEGAIPLLDRAFSGFQGTGIATLEGVRTLSSFRHLEQVPWLLAAHTPLREAYAPVDRAGGYFLYAVCAVSVLAFSATWLLMHRLTLPLTRFSAHARGLAGKSGPERFFRAPPGGEIGELADSFNAMLRDLDRQYEALQRKEEQLREAQELGRIGHWEFDLETRSVTWSEQIYRLFGRDPAGSPPGFIEFLGCYPSPDRRRLLDLIESALHEGVEGGGDFTTTLADGRRRHHSATVRVRRNAAGKVVRLWGTIQDVTDRKQAEQALRESELRFRQMVNLLPQAVFEADLEGCLTFVNAWALERFGFDRRDVEAGVNLLELVAPEERTTARDNLAELAAGTDLAGRQRTLLTKAGEPVPAMVYTSVLRDGEKPAGILGIVADLSELRRLEEEVVDTHARLIEAYRLARMGYWEYDPQTDRLELSGEARQLLGLPRGQRLERRGEFLALVHPEDRQALAGTIRAGRREYRIVHPDGTTIHLQEHVENVLSPEGTLLHSFGTIQDVSEVRQAQQAQAEERAKLFRVLEELPAYVYLQATDHSVRFANRYFRDRFGEPGTGPCYRLLRDRSTPCPECPTLATLKNGPCQWEWTDAPDGRCYEVHDFPFTDTDGTALVLEIGFDVTERKRAEQILRDSEAEMRHQAHHDPLTGLPNRLLLQEHLELALGKCRRYQRRLALMFLDLDRFKAVNDRLGHEAGDRLLCQVGERLKACVRETDTVARLGGDEFVLIVEEVETLGPVAAIADKICRRLAAPFILSGREVAVTTSLGIALYPGDADDATGLMQAADTAMFRAKDAGRNNYQFHAAGRQKPTGD